MHDDSTAALDVVEHVKRRGGSVYFIKGWHLWLTVFITITSIILTVGIAWGSMSAKVEQNARDIEEMKSEKYVPKTDYWRDLDELRRSIEQMNGKLDALNRLMK